MDTQYCWAEILSNMFEIENEGAPHFASLMFEIIMTIEIENQRCCPSRPCRASWRTGLGFSRSSSSPCSSSSSPWWSSPWSSSRDGEGQKQNVLNRKAWTCSSMFTQFRWHYHLHQILPRCQNFISLLQDKDKNEYLLKASETYEPLNVNFVDLYQVRNWFTKPSPFQSWCSNFPHNLKSDSDPGCIKLWLKGRPLVQLWIGKQVFKFSSCLLG